MAPTKMKAFKTIKKNAGKVANKLSFNLTLTTTPANISNVRPREETTRIKLNFCPTINPRAPKNSKIIIKKPIFCSLKRLNSSFICGPKK